MVYHVVVRAVYAATVLTGLERAHHGLGRPVECDRGDREAGRVFPKAIEIHARREVRAGFRDRATVGAAVRYFGTDGLAHKMRERAR